MCYYIEGECDGLMYYGKFKYDLNLFKENF